MLVNGQWSANWHPVQATDAKGGFVRQTSSFRNWITPDGAAGPTGEAGFAAAPGRYHLYAGLICPWASRALIARKLKRLDKYITVSIVEPTMTDQGWRFGDYPGADRDAVNGATYMHEIYTRADPHYTGRATVPVLWDKQRNRARRCLTCARKVRRCRRAEQTRLGQSWSSRQSQCRIREEAGRVRGARSVLGVTRRG